MEIESFILLKMVTCCISAIVTPRFQFVQGILLKPNNLSFSAVTRVRRFKRTLSRRRNPIRLNHELLQEMLLTENDQTKVHQYRGIYLTEKLPKCTSTVECNQF